MRLSWWMVSFLLLSWFGGASGMAGTVEWNFTPQALTDGALPLIPTQATLGGTVEDWSLHANPANPVNSAFASDFSQGFLHFTDLESISGNLSLKSSARAELRNSYRLSGEGDRLWIVCDYQMLQYGRRADGESSALDSNMAQVFWTSFQTSGGSDIGLQYVAGNFNAMNFLYFTAIGCATETQGEYQREGNLIENLVNQPNLERRTVYIRVTENTHTTVSIDVKFDTNPYKTINPSYAGSVHKNAAGGDEGDENTLVCIGNNSPAGDIEFNLWRLAITDQDPEGTAVRHWPLY